MKSIIQTWMRTQILESFNNSEDYFDFLRNPSKGGNAQIDQIASELKLVFILFLALGIGIVILLIFIKHIKKR